MRTHTFISDFDFTEKDLEIQDPNILKQIKSVLRLKEGDSISLCDGQGTIAPCSIKKITQSSILCDIAETKKEPKPENKTTLYLSILKKENFELAVQKSTECGVWEIVPVISERTVKMGLNYSRLEKIAKEASEQSGRAYVPKIREALKFDSAISDGAKNDNKIIFHLDGEDFRENPSLGNSISIFVGPEGGFTEEELQQAKEKGYKNLSLGPLTLRAETAAIISTFVITNLN